MKVKNNSERKLHINVEDENGVVEVIGIEAGSEFYDERIKKQDVAIYVKKKRIKIIDESKNKTDDSKSDSDKDKDKDPIVLPENPTIESLVKMPKDDLQEYCRQNKIKGFSKLNEEELAKLILSSLEPKE